MRRLVAYLFVAAAANLAYAAQLLADNCTGGREDCGNTLGFFTGMSIALGGGALASAFLPAPEPLTGSGGDNPEEAGTADTAMLPGSAPDDAGSLTEPAPAPTADGSDIYDSVFGGGEAPRPLPIDRPLGEDPPAGP